MINNGLEDKITNQTTFREYGEKLYKAFTDSLIYPDILFNNLDKVTGEGTNITLNGTIKSLLKLDLSGNTTQEDNPTPSTPKDIHVVSGENTIKVMNKNLLYLNNYNANYNSQTYTNFGNYLQVKSSYGINVNILASGNSYKITGLNAYDLSQVFKFTGLEPNTKYTVSCNISTNLSSGTVRVFDQNMNYDATYKASTFTTDQNGEHEYTLMFYNLKGNDNYCELYNIQLEKNTTATSYEEHKEQTYPINLPIENLLSLSTLQLGYVTTTGTITTGGITNEERYSNFIKVKPNTQYTFKMFKSNWSGFNTNNWIGIGEYTSNNTSSFIQRDTMTTTTQNYYTFTTTSTTEYVILSARGLGSAIEIQFSEGTYNVYTPFGMEPLELCKIGDYKDEIVKKENKWHLRKKVRKLELAIANMRDNENYPGWENVPYLHDDYPGYNIGTFPSDVKSNIGGYSNSYGLNTTGATQSTFILNKSSWNLTATQWKTNYPNLILDFYYGLETPEDILLNDTLQVQLNDIEKAISYNEQTNISQTNSDLGFIISASAIKQLEI